MKRLRWMAPAPVLALLAAAGAAPEEGALRVRFGPPETEPAPPDGGVSATVAAADGALWRAWWMRPAPAGDRCIIVPHGVADRRKSSLGLAPVFLRAGYRALLPDSRGHGASRGDLVGCGALEAAGIVRWLRWMEAQGCRTCFGLGESLGGAVLLQALERGAPLRAVVAESSFAGFSEVAKDRVAARLPFGAAAGRALAAPGVGIGIRYVRARYGLDLSAASPLRSVAASSAPVLLIHGRADRETPPSHPERLVHARAGVEWWMPEGIGHTGAWAHPEFAQRVLSFCAAR
jgi:hypothetical protein